MARPKTKGATIGVQLPLELDALVRERAEAHGETVSAYLSRNIVRFLKAPGSKPAISTGAAVPSLPSKPAPGECEHRSSRALDEPGKRVCKRCGEILTN